MCVGGGGGGGGRGRGVPFPHPCYEWALVCTRGQCDIYVNDLSCANITGSLPYPGILYGQDL